MTKTGATADIVLSDWGTSSLLLWALDRQGRLLDERRSDSGMGTLSYDGYAPELQRHLAAMGVPDETPVLICGMAGAAQGWQEAPYLEAPTGFAALADGAITIAGQMRAGQMRAGQTRAGRARDYLANGLDRMEAMGAGEPRLLADLAAADLLPDDPAVLFALLDEPYRRRLNTVFELSHE